MLFSFSSWSLYICLSRQVRELVKVFVVTEKTLDSPRTEYIYSQLNAQMNPVEAGDGAFILTSPVLDFL